MKDSFCSSMTLYNNLKKTLLLDRGFLWGYWYPQLQTSDDTAHGFKASVDSSLPMLFCHLCTTIPRAISGCQEKASNPDRPPVRRAWYHGANPVWLVVKTWYRLMKNSLLICDSLQQLNLLARNPSENLPNLMWVFSQMSYHLAMKRSPIALIQAPYSTPPQEVWTPCVRTHYPCGYRQHLIFHPAVYFSS